MAKKKALLLDVDEVVVFGGFLEAGNEFLGTSYEIDDFTNYYIDEEAIPKERMDEFNEFLKGRNMYANAELLPGAFEAIKKLSEVYDIYICSGCVNPFDKEVQEEFLWTSIISYLKHYHFLNLKILSSPTLNISLKQMFKLTIDCPI